MPQYIAFLRALNVGGRYYKMAALRAHLEESGLEQVETYIQTGNVRFATRMRSVAKVEQHVERCLADGCGFAVPAIVFTPSQLADIYRDAQAIPVPPRLGDGTTLKRYVTFFKEADAPTADEARELGAWDSDGEAMVAIGRAVHILLNRPSVDAKLYGRFKKTLAPGTNRDLKVVAALAERWGDM